MICYVSTAVSQVRKLCILNQNRSGQNAEDGWIWAILRTQADVHAEEEEEEGENDSAINSGSNGSNTVTTEAEDRF